MIRAIVAMGRQGQLGLNGVLPWNNPEDLAHFKRRTMEGGVLVAGWRTLQTLPTLVGRSVLLDDTRLTVPQMIDRMGSDLWIIGGAKTYNRWAPWVQVWDISRVDYQGPADCFFNLQWIAGQQDP